ncbi:adenylyl-sulfate kinase [Haloparvum alkalitolerans]|uniref:adenylyl-sulfate kinase n=1 Tax=Haloparvum alkalitolerans TaxID=1042953 RepID=UPI003CE701D4
MSFTLWFMGRPASGKSTLAKRVEEQLRTANLSVENLDGDEVRKNLHPDLGFSREERALNNRRTAFVCKLLNRNGINAVTAMITPFRDSQHQAREIIEESGEFVLVYVKCPLDVAAERDPKNLYEKARAGKIEKFTGVNHPFQTPIDPDIVVDTASESVDESVDHVMKRLDDLGVFDDETLSQYDFDITQGEESSIKQRLEDLGYFK